MKQWKKSDHAATAKTTARETSSPEGGGFGLSSGGVIDRGTPPENIDALVEASEKFGEY